MDECSTPSYHYSAVLYLSTSAEALQACNPVCECMHAGLQPDVCMQACTPAVQLHVCNPMRCSALLHPSTPPLHYALQADAEAATSIAAAPEAARVAADRQRHEQTRDAADFAGGELRFYGRPMEVVLQP